MIRNIESTIASPADAPLSDEQRNYLEGLTSGVNASRALRGQPTLAAAVAGLTSPAQTPVALTASVIGPDSLARAAQDRTIAAGGKLCPEEKAKREKSPLDMWDEIAARAERGEFPKGTDVLLTKFHGLFYVAPAQDSYMCRLRLPAGVINSHQLRGVADVAERYGGPYAHITTRANLQIREIGPRDPLNVYTALTDLGIIPRGSGADNIRNITASPTAGIDAAELIDTRPLARELHHYILNHREMYGLPRKFNIAFDGGGSISALAETNDISFAAVRVVDANATPDCPAGVWFRMELGGITGHGDFARDTGVMLRPQECTAVAAATVRVFIMHGDRTDRRKARLKYLLDAWGFEKYLAAVEAEIGRPLRRFPLDRCEPRPAVDPLAHIGPHPQKQPGLCYIGAVLPVGKITCEQMRAVARLAEEYGSGSIRLTVWQNLLITDVPDCFIDDVKIKLERMGLHWSATNVRAGLVACTGNTGCRFAASETKRHAAMIADHLDARLRLDTPINIHLTGCHHSCAQHYIGDIGLLATKLERGDETIEGYHLVVGGGIGEHRGIGREIARDVPADEAPARIERMFAVYLRLRRDPSETFRDFCRRHDVNDLIRLFDEQPTEIHA